MTSPGPAFQDCTGSCHENVSNPKVVSSDLRSTNDLTVLVRIEIVTINHPTHCCLSMSLYAEGCILQANLTSLNTYLAITGFPQSDHTVSKLSADTGVHRNEA